MANNNQKNVLYFAENAISPIQGGGIVVYSVLKGLPSKNLLGFFQYRNITPADEYKDRFHYLGVDRIPKPFRSIFYTNQTVENFLRTVLFNSCSKLDFDFVLKTINEQGFKPDIVYFSGLSLRFLRLAVMAAEHFDVPMAVLHMDDWMEVEKHRLGKFGETWYRRIVENMTEAARRSLASTTNSPSLANKITQLTGYEHKPANNCCEDLLQYRSSHQSDNDIPIITYAGALNWQLQGETLITLVGAIAELNAEGTRVQLHVYTPWEFAHLINANQIPGCVFYKGQVRKEQLTDIYLSSDFLITSVTFRRENLHLFRHSLSTKLSEYLCVGKPVISIGHPEWHLHEYVQEHDCGFSIYMDEKYKRSHIKAQLIKILATPKKILHEIGLRNRSLWEKAHDVKLKAQETRKAIGLDD